MSRRSSLQGRFTQFARLGGVFLMLVASLPLPATAAGLEKHHPASGAYQLAPGLTETNVDQEIQADTFGLPLAQDAISEQYGKPSVFLQAEDAFSFSAEIAETGNYTISFDMAAAESFIKPPKAQLLVDGTFPLPDAQSIGFPIFHQNSADAFPLDRYGNEALIRQERLIRWSRVAMRDVNFSQDYPLQVNLTQGRHEFEFRLTQESMYLGSIYLQPYFAYPDYEQYLSDNPYPDSTGAMIEIEAEFPSFKNDTSIRPVSSRSLDVTPYDTYKLLLNTLGGDSWKNSGTTVYYEFDVPADGMYSITLRAQQNTRNNFTVFRKITINDSVLFEQLTQVPFHYSPDWQDITLGGDTAYKFYLKKGTNLLGIEATNSPYYLAIEKIKKVLLDINALSLEVKKLTGNQVDRYREWVISEYIPDIQERLIAIADDLRTDLDVLTAINQVGGSQEIMSYQVAIDNIMFLAEDPDKIPIYLNRFSEGSGSSAQLLGDLLPLLQSQPLALDKIFIHSPDITPGQVAVPFWTSLTEGLKRFVYSFKPNLYQGIAAEEGELEVWVNRPRQYVDLLQLITDQAFTQETGIRVKFSILPNESKLTLATAANIQPDVAIGVSTNIPYELAIRNALYDLRTFEDFDSFIRIYSPGAFLSYIINDSVYAIPETQDFWVTFYRRDILDSLGIPVPRTWNEVVEILPELQRNGMNYNTPLSSGAGTKNYLLTSPYIFNYNARLYNDDGFSTGLSSDEALAAIKFMTESFTIYGMPLETASFYNSFRYGDLPLGISNVETYIKLLTAAPEIAGLWDIELYPATVLEDGTENRYATGSAQACIVFAKTQRAEDAWQFLKWWMSTDTQIEFQQQLILNYGNEYLWYSANLDAFPYLPIPEKHKAIILEQWQWLQEPVKLPGSYMEERQLSNVWNEIVFNGVNPRVAIDNSIIIINREITRKMEEFGYLQDGVIVKQFKMPTIESVKRWMEDAK